MNWRSTWSRRRCTPRGNSSSRSVGVTPSPVCGSLSRRSRFHLVIPHDAQGGADMWVRLLEFDSGKELECHKGHHGPVHCLRFSPFGDTYTSGSVRRCSIATPAPRARSGSLPCPRADTTPAPPLESQATCLLLYCNVNSKALSRDPSRRGTTTGLQCSPHTPRYNKNL